MSARSSANYVLLTRLADEFAARYRAGERPALQEYIDRYPELEEDIRELFPAMVEIEQVKEDNQEATERAAAPVSPALQQLGDFRIIREVGKGGMGIVYEAEQVSLGRHVALKVMPKNLLVDSQAKRRFEREAKSAAKLHHTNIVPVFGVGEQDGLPYYVMQFIQGLGLDQVLEELKKLQPGTGKTGTFHGDGLRAPRRELSAANVARSLLTGEFPWKPSGNSQDDAAAAPATVALKEDAPAAECCSPPLSDSFTLSSSSVVLLSRGRDTSTQRRRKQSYWQSVAGIGVQVADALEYAHKQGVQHRDIKPSNLLLDTQGTVWVTDFGLAKADDQQNLTHTGDVLGTLRYMPPEAFEGKSDVRSDVYSLGLTLYEMLALRPAFDEKDRNRLIKQVAQEEPAPLGRLNRQVPQDLQTIVHKAIDREPGRRYQKAADLGADLERFIKDEPIEARRVSQSERCWRWCRRNPLVAGLAALLLLVLLAGFAGVTWKWQDAERQKEVAQVAKLREAVQREIAVKQADNATREADRSRRLLYASDMNLAMQAWEAGDTGRAQALLERQRPQAGQEDLRGFEWRYLWPLCRDASRLTLRGHTAEINTVAFSPDGRTLVTSDEHTICIWDMASQRHTKLLAYRVRSIAFAPDGKTLAIGEWMGKRVSLWDVNAHSERASLPHPSRVWCVAFSPDGKLLITDCADGTVRIWDLAARRQVGALAGSAVPSFRIVCSPDGSTLAAGLANGTVRLWDMSERRAIATLQGHTAAVTSLCFSPDSKVLASSSADTTVRLWNAVTGQSVKTLRGQRTVLRAVAFSPDGKALATGGGDGTVRIWDAATQEVKALLRGHAGPVTAIAYAPDGQTLVSGSQDGTVKVWDVAPKPDPSTLTDTKADTPSVAFSPDGKTLAVADPHDQTVKLWEPSSRQPVAVLRGHERPPLCVAFARDGRTLASAGLDWTVRLWDVAAHKQISEFRHSDPIGSAAFSPDGRLLAAGCWGAEIVLVWDIAARRQVAMLQTGNMVQFSPDGRWLAAISGDTVRFWDVATWQKVASFSGETARLSCFAFAPTGKILATGDVDGTVQLWDLAAKRKIVKRKGHTSTIEFIAFSPDGRRLATGGQDSTVKLWDAGALQEMVTLKGHDGPVHCVAFSPDSNTLATASADGTVRLWHAPPMPETVADRVDAPGMQSPTEILRLLALEVNGTSRATVACDGNARRVNVSEVDGTDWHVMLLQVLDDLEEGATYTIRFRAKADVPRVVKLSGQIAQPDWHSTGLSEDVPLTTDWKTYQYEYRPKDLAGWNRVQFLVGDRTGNVWVADFSVTKKTK